MVERSVIKSEQQGDGGLLLPSGFRFHPTDEEIIMSYLLEKVLNPSFDPVAMGEVNLNKVEPWDLPSKAKMGEHEWFFFSHKDMKYPTGSRTNRATKEGYWKATGKDREIFDDGAAIASSGGGPGGGRRRRRELVGMKKTLVFYLGRAPRGTKTDWVMHEFRLHGSTRENNNLQFNPKDEWVVCKVFHKKGEHAGGNKAADKDKEKAAGGEEVEAEQQSGGTPNASSVVVEAATDAEGDDFVDSFMIDPVYNFTSANDDDGLHGGAEPYDSGYSSIISSTAAAAATRTTAIAAPISPSSMGRSFVVDPPNNSYSFMAMANSSTVPRSSGGGGYGSSWSALHAAPGGHAAMGGGNYDLLQQQQAMMLNHLGGGGNFAGGLPSSSPVAGALQQINYSLGVPQRQIKPAGNYGDSSYAAAYNLATGRAADKNSGAHGARRY